MEKEQKKLKGRQKLKKRKVFYDEDVNNNILPFVLRSEISLYESKNDHGGFKFSIKLEIVRSYCVSEINRLTLIILVKFH